MNVKPKEAGMVQVFVKRRTLTRIVNCLRLAAVRVRRLDPDIAVLFDLDADELERQSLSY